jgi:hypothetical protein
VTIKAFNIKTGVVKEERVYTWTLSGQPPFAIAGGSALLDGNDLYVFQDDKIVQYDFAKYVPDGKPVKKWYRPYSNAEVVGSIYKERMFFIDYATGELKGMKLANGQQIGWRGDNPAAQTDIFGNGVYIGQTDGLFHGFNLQTTAAAFTVNTGSRNYGPTLKTGEMIVIQTEGRLISVKIPKSLK